MEIWEERWWCEYKEIYEAEMMGEDVTRVWGGEEWGYRGGKVKSGKIRKEREGRERAESER